MRNKSNNSKQINSTYQSLYLWTSFLLSLISLGLIWQRMSGTAATNSVSQQNLVLSTHDNSHSSYQIQFPGLTPLVLSGALAYQTGNPAVGLFGSLPLWLVTPVVAQNPRVVVPEFRVSNLDLKNSFYPAVTGLASGDWVVAWAEFRPANASYDIYTQRYNSNGGMLGSKFRVNSIVNSTIENNYPVVTSLSSGGWVVSWGHGPSREIYARLFSSNGNPLDVEFLLCGSDKLDCVIASLISGEWVVVWSNCLSGGCDIYAQRYMDNGTALLTGFRVNTNTVGDQVGPAIASSTSGEWWIAWSDRSAHWVQRYALNGSVLGLEFQVSNMPDYISSPQITSLPYGEWLSVWGGKGNGTGASVYSAYYGQRYSANGSILGSAFPLQLNFTSPYYLTLTGLISGGWILISVNDSGNGIYAQLYAENGSLFGSRFRVDSNKILGSKFTPVVTNLASGNVLIAWNGNWNIYATIFSVDSPSLTTT